jgi:DNA-binding CsgD family transcriptional regulator
MEEVLLQAFSSTVRDLYALAEYAAPEQFLSQAIGLLQTWIRFDGVIFGTGGEVGKPLAKSLSTADSTAPVAIGPQPAKLQESLRDDPVAKGFRNAPLAPSRGGIRELYRKSKHGKRGKAKGRELSGVRTMAEELGLCHLIVHGDDPKKVSPARWIVLYRQHDVRFAESDAACLHGLWTHLSRALVINQARAIERNTGKSNNERGMASGLITAEGRVEIADPRFFSLLEREWPELEPEVIPTEVMDFLLSGKIYRGTQIEITLVRQQGGHLCRIRPVNAMEILTPREFVVARRFASGMSHKQIARELGVSHHTVRNQLAHLYRKLNLHDKASLAQYLITNAAPA